MSPPLEVNRPSRRQWLAGVGAGATLAAAGSLTAAESPQAETRPAAAAPFGYCLNTSTVRGRAKTILEQIDVAAKAGYDGIEPWIRDLTAYVQQGGKPAELRKRIADAGLKVVGAIGFAPWIVDDELVRVEGLASARRDMELVREIGGTRMAAPPVGATKEPALDLQAAAQRYGALLKVGESEGVTPLLEVWGFSRNLSRLGESAYVAIESGHPRASLLLDVYHLYKGGSDFSGLRLLNGSAMHLFHMNDYPADPPREEINDAARVFPGRGVAPLTEILRTLRDTGFSGMLSLELFNREYWERDPQQVAREGLESMRASVAKAVG
ncbi:MAG: sugar phosphate isomerase/epimerase family protein [Pirellulaceae bacterium]